MTLRSILLAVLIATGTSTTLSANPGTEQWFKKSVITLTDISEVPGMVVEPGTYVLKADEQSSFSRTTIELLNQDETQTLATFVAVADHRQRPNYDTLFTYFPGVTNGPKPIQTWFYPGDMNGYEFVYPKPRAKEIAQVTEDHVMASESKEAAIVALTPTGIEVPVFDSVAKATNKINSQEVTREKPQATPKPKKPSGHPPRR
jgi:hypothetical protein